MLLFNPCIQSKPNKKHHIYCQSFWKKKKKSNLQQKCCSAPTTSCFKFRILLSMQNFIKPEEIICMRVFFSFGLICMYSQSNLIDLKFTPFKGWIFNPLFFNLTYRNLTPKDCLKGTDKKKKKKKRKHLAINSVWKPNPKGPFALTMISTAKHPWRD